MKPLKFLIVLLAFSLGTASAQDAPADNMDILKDKISADKKLMVATNMALTESEASAFWPLYEQYQEELQALNQRTMSLVENYAAAYRENMLTDEKAAELVEEMLALEQAEVDLRTSFAPKLGEVLPAKKVARYLQIERKVRAVLAYELAAGIPLVN